VKGVALESGIVFFLLHLFGLGLFIAGGEIPGRALALFASLGAFKNDHFTCHKEVIIAREREERQEIYSVAKRLRESYNTLQ
jgi:hypothetical protein